MSAGQIVSLQFAANVTGFYANYGIRLGIKRGIAAESLDSCVIRRIAGSIPTIAGSPVKG